MFWHILRRIWDVIVGTLMIVLSLAFQAIFGMILMLAYMSIIKMLGWEESAPGEAIAIPVLMLILNAIAFFEYFRLRRATVGLGGDASIIFLLPRGIDRIITGSERIHR